MKLFVEVSGLDAKSRQWEWVEKLNHCAKLHGQKSRQWLVLCLLPKFCKNKINMRKCILLQYITHFSWSVIVSVTQSFSQYSVTLVSHSVIQSFSQSINHSLNHSLRESVSQRVIHFVIYSVNDSISKSVISHSISQSFCHSVSHWVSQSVRQSDSPSISHSVSPSVIWSFIQSASKWVWWSIW